MTVTEAKRKVYRKCGNCRLWLCGVWCAEEPAERFGQCAEHGYAYKEGEEDCCKSFDYADWAVKKMMREGEGAAE